jgi:ankyrin
MRNLFMKAMVCLCFRFLVSFVVDARGGAMRGCRHSGLRIIVPPGRACAPMRITCKLVRRDKLSNPPPLNDGESLATRILKLGPAGATFSGFALLELLSL